MNSCNTYAALLRAFLSAIQLRAQYSTGIGEVKLSDLVFLDETGINLAMTRGYARAKKGNRAYPYSVTFRVR